MPMVTGIAGVQKVLGWPSFFGFRVVLHLNHPVSQLPALKTFLCAFSHFSGLPFRY
jgi:hypothetical protein